MAALRGGAAITKFNLCLRVEHPRNIPRNKARNKTRMPQVIGTRPPKKRPAKLTLADKPQTR